MAKKRMGRPPKAQADRATVQLHFRVTPDDAALIREAAASAPYAGVSGWIRDRVLKAARREVGRQIK